MSNEKKHNCRCECIEELKELLKKHKGDFVGIYEKNGNAVFGVLQSVHDDVVKIVGSGNGDTFFPIKFWSPGCPLTQHAQAYYVSICQITELALNPDAPVASDFCTSPPTAQTKKAWKRS